MDEILPPEYDEGLSPYTRGNQSLDTSAHLYTRSIPVHTGKPLQKINELRHDKVYPRTHGETTSSCGTISPSRGLSPYTRGNQASAAPVNLSAGSIPVHTGKPSCACICSAAVGVYPRTHGETKLYAGDGNLGGGLSPYTRGNPYNDALV